jgi:hypothetical protein
LGSYFYWLCCNGFWPEIGETMSAQSDGIEFILQMLERSFLETENAIAPDRLDTFEWRDPRPAEKTDWLAIADSICHDPYRRRK